MTGEGQNISLNKLSIKTHNGLLGKSLDAQTDFGELHLAGQYDYAQIPESVRRILGHYLPSFSTCLHGIILSLEGLTMPLLCA